MSGTRVYRRGRYSYGPITYGLGPSSPSSSYRYTPRYRPSTDYNYHDLWRLFEYGPLDGDEDDEAEGRSPGGREEDAERGSPGSFGSRGGAETRRPREPKPDPADEEVLKVVGVNLNVAENTTKHHTDKYDITEGSKPKLVIRRGQEFTAQIDFSRKYDVKKDDLRLVFEIGDAPKPSKGTHVEFVLSDKDKAGEWGAKLTQQQGKSVSITFFTPPTCFVGKWAFKVDVVKRKDDKTFLFRYTHKDPIYILFNPWCKEDTVYMEGVKEKEEYVLKDSGKIWVGSVRSFTGKPWFFGQFEGNVLDCVMRLLDNSDLGKIVRGNAIPVVRKLTALVNSSDEGGVLIGNWSGDYSGGTSPLRWTGSVKILEEYYAQNFSVAFGQCWVFSGVLTTVLRALGIPARSVTNFASAHDCDGSITIDAHFDEDGAPQDHKNEDSIWNFHVWNEVWLARPDLPTGYGGWQACDATPQEASDGIYCCGPTSVRAIREGEVNLPYDGPFVFAEVNADKVDWICYKDGRNEISTIKKNIVGKNMSTKALGSNYREDVTGNYKYREGSDEERVAVRRANQVGCASDMHRGIYKAGPCDVEFSLEADTENMWVGQDFKVHLKAVNKSGMERSFWASFVPRTMYYTGVSAEELPRKKFNVQLKPGETKDVEISVTPDKYLRKLKDCCMLTVFIMAKVAETKQIFTGTEVYRLRKPHLTIKAPARGKVWEEFDVQVSFINPLPCTLTNCYLDVDGPGMGGARKYPEGDVPIKGTFNKTIKLKPRRARQTEIIFIFNCNELEDVNSTHEMVISK